MERVRVGRDRASYTAPLIALVGVVTKKYNGQFPWEQYGGPYEPKGPVQEHHLEVGVAQRSPR